MNFLHPNILWFLSLLALPIIIHLFHFRRHKKLYFSSLKFIQSFQEEKKAIKKVKDLLILLFRILAVLFLVLAFAQPYTGTISNSAATSDSLIFLYIDNSNSMSAKGMSGELLSQAKSNAKEIVSQYPASQKFIIASNELNGIQEHTLNQQDALFEIDQINYTPVQRNLNTVINWQREVSSKEKKNNHKLQKINYIILSDFQKDFFHLENIKNDDDGIYNMIQFQPQKISNCYVDSIWFESPVHRINEENELFFRIVNKGNEEIINLEVSIESNDLKKDLFVDIPGKKSSKHSVQLKNTKKGPVFGKIEIRDQMMYWDDIFYFSYTIEPSNEILLIQGEEPEKHVLNALETEPFLKIVEINQKAVNRNLFKNKNLIVLNGITDISSGLTADLVSFSKMGGAIFFIPGENIKTGQINLLLEQLGLPIIMGKRTTDLNTSKVAFDDPFFKSIFEQNDESLNLPYYHQKYSCDYRSNTAIPLMFLRDGSPVFFKSMKQAFAFYSDLSSKSTDLVNKSIFPVICIRITELSKRQSPLYHFIGQNELIAINNTSKSESPIKIKNESSEFIPKILQNGSYQFIDLSGPEAVERLKDGNYSVLLNEFIIPLSLNIDRKESSVNYIEIENIKKSMQAKNIKNVEVDDFSKNMDLSKINLNLPKEYWRICIFIVLTCILSEILISKFWKN
tara:strand:- start:4098 stop:6140 length:2043 start_codon:yes stop_codon:yes gene_type:complete